jgi:hypothetical protein
MPDHEHIQKLVDRALRFPVAERRAFLVGACGDDEALRREVERRVSEVSTSAPSIPQT